ncbi:TOC75-3 protein [Spatholobus suberectus]|nr:TOC75-3 protein [Spatholobus suberectus]
MSSASAVAAAAAILFFTNPNGFIGGGGIGGAGVNAGGGGGGGGGSDGGSFWSRLFSPAAALADEPESPEWDSHGHPVNIVVQLNKLSGFKKYKISSIVLFDRIRKAKLGSEDSFFEMVTLSGGGVYTKAQLQKELETLASCGMFQKVDMEGKTNADGSMALTISFTESMWQSAERFRCINVGLMKPVEMDPDSTDKERDHQRRIENARPCLLPMSVQSEITDMLRSQGNVSARLLQRIRDRVQKWYHDEGYV